MIDDVKLIAEAISGVSADALWIFLFYTFFNYMKVLTIAGLLSFTVLRLSQNKGTSNGTNKSNSNTL